MSDSILPPDTTTGSDENTDQSRSLSSDIIQDLEQLSTLLASSAVANEGQQIIYQVNTPREVIKGRIAQVISFRDGVKHLKSKTRLAMRKETSLKKAKESERKNTKPLPPINGLTDKMGLFIPQIAGGEITKVSVPATIDNEYFLARQGKTELARAAKITHALGKVSLSLDEAVRALFAFTQGKAAEDFNSLNRDQQFHTVAEILIRIWPGNYMNHLNDRRVSDCIGMITNKDAFGRIASLLRTFGTMSL